MSSSTHTHWGMVINNYDDTDLALVAQAYPDHIRKLTYTKEVGEGGTPHIQAFIKMKRDCRLSHMKKLFPKGHFNYLETLEYKLNAERYAQKQDGTADGPSVITNGDPLHTIEGTIRVIINRMRNEYPHQEDMDLARRYSECDLIMEDYSMAKVFVSSTYKSMWKEFGHTMYRSVVRAEANKNPTHTHTHTQEVEVPTPTYFLKEYRDVEVQTDALTSSGSEDDDQAEASDGCSVSPPVSTCDDSDGGEEDSEGTDCS